jgi:DNA gyrase subunit A
MDVPEGGRSAKGLAIVNLVSLSQDETVTAFIPVSEFDEEHFLVMLTQKAFIKKVAMSEFSSIRRSGIIAINLGQGDQLGWVRPSTGKSHIVIGTSEGMTIRYEESELNPLGRAARGVKAITLREKDKIVGFDVVEPNDDSHLLLVTTDGYGKRVKLESEFRVQGRGGIGLIGIKFKNANSRMAAVRVVLPGEEVIIATANGIVVRQEVDKISAQSRMATGVRIQQLSDDDQVISVTPIVQTGKDDLVE